MTTMFEDLKNGLKEVDAFLAGETAGYKVSVPTDVDVKAIRGRLNMTQAKFSDTFGFSLDAVKHWEGGRRTPEAPARALLRVIDYAPKTVLSALRADQKAAFVVHETKARSGKMVKAKSITIPTHAAKKTRGTKAKIAR